METDSRLVLAILGDTMAIWVRGQVNTDMCQNILSVSRERAPIFQHRK